MISFFLPMLYYWEKNKIIYRTYKGSFIEIDLQKKDYGLLKAEYVYIPRNLGGH